MKLGSLDLGKIGDRLRRLDRFLVRILKTRLAQGGLSDLVAEVKRRTSTNGVFPKKRQEIEDQRIALFKKWAVASGLDPNFAAALMYAIISESCRVQDDYMVRKIADKTAIISETDPEAIFQMQINDLLALTKRVAGVYDQNYGQDFFATQLLLGFEKKIAQDLIEELPHKDLLVDLGCATGKMSLPLAKLFQKTIGFDISPEMIQEAEKKAKSLPDVLFQEKNLENGTGLAENSVSLFIMNMGTASEIKNLTGLIEEIRQCLKPGGKILLSFYNAESLLLKLGFLPWPVQLAAFIDQGRNCLEVHFQDQVYNLFAQARNATEIHQLLKKFSNVEIFSFPTLSSIIPAIVLSDEDQSGQITPNQKAQEMIKRIDYALSDLKIYSGTYLIATATK